MLLGLLVYGYANGVFSSRKIERATHDSLAFRYIAAGLHPDHDTLASFRRRFLDELSGLFVQVLEMARKMKLLALGTISLDSTKVKANASRHSALSHGHIEQLEVQLKTEVEALLAQAEQADQSSVPDGMSLPAEIARRQARLDAMAAPRPGSKHGRKPGSSKSRSNFKPGRHGVSSKPGKAASRPVANRPSLRSPDPKSKTRST